jgi:ribosome maturation factor RimP
LLEVSSPGPQRPLRSISDFVQHKGKKVKIKLSVPYEGKRDVFVGQVESVKEDCINISDSGELYTIKYANIEKANLNL